MTYTSKAIGVAGFASILLAGTEEQQAAAEALCEVHGEWHESWVHCVRRLRDALLPLVALHPEIANDVLRV